MPVKLGSKLPSDEPEARIEIVPLIDIMFFLLASFMLVSLSMVNMKSVKVNLPTASTAAADVDRDVMNVSVDKSGAMYFNSKPVADNELVRMLKAAVAQKPSRRLIISGDRDARHGDMIHVLDLVRSAGIEKVAFDIRPSANLKSP